MGEGSEINCLLSALSGQPHSLLGRRGAISWGLSQGTPASQMDWACQGPSGGLVLYPQPLLPTPGKEMSPDLCLEPPRHLSNGKNKLF